MPNASPPPEQFARYLRLLGVPAQRPAVAALEQIVRAHVTRVPFENVSKLYYRHDEGMHLPPLSRFLDGIERNALGGTCYANNWHLSTLLSHVGYDVRLCGADMSQPDVHMVCVVRLEGREYLVDGGYGAPFLSPMPLDGEREQALQLGAERWVLLPKDEAGRSRLEMYRNGERIHGYVLNPAPRRIEEFAHVVADSFRPAATFMNTLVIARFGNGSSRTLRHRTLIEADGDTTRVREAAPDLERLPAAVQALFGMPEAIVREALAGLPPERQP